MAKQHSSTEIFENPEALQATFNKSEEFVKKNKKIILIVVGVIVAAVLGLFAWKYYKENKELEGSKAIYVAEDYFRKDSLDLALNGDGESLGFLEIAKRFGGTSVGDLANYYIGAIYLTKGKFQESINHLEEYNTGAFLVQARAYCLMGDAYSELGKKDEAIKYYSKAADDQANDEFTPGYLVKLALEYENAGKISDAALTYETIVKEYPKFQQIDDVKKYLAALMTEADLKN